MFKWLLTDFSNLDTIEIGAATANTLPDEGVSAALWNARGNLKRISKLVLHNIRILPIDTMAMLVQLFQGLQSIEFNLGHKAYSRLPLAVLKDSTTLKAFKLIAQGTVDIKVYRPIEDMQTLKSLILSAVELPLDVLALVGKLPQLTELSLRSVAGETTAFYAHFHHLQGLPLKSIKLTLGKPASASSVAAAVASLQQLGSYPQLQTLVLEPPLSSKQLAFQALRQLSGLREFKEGSLRVVPDTSSAYFGFPGTGMLTLNEFCELWPTSVRFSNLAVGIDVAPHAGTPSWPPKDLVEKFAAIKMHVTHIPSILISLGNSRKDTDLGFPAGLGKLFGQLDNIKAITLQDFCLQKGSLAALFSAMELHLPRTLMLQSCAGAADALTDIVGISSIKHIRVAKCEGVTRFSLLSLALLHPATELTITSDLIMQSDVAELHQELQRNGKTGITFRSR